MMAEQIVKEKIHIFIVDDVSETVNNLRKLLYFESDMEVVGSAGSAQEAVELAQKLKPDVVLMDINFPSGPEGISAAEAITQANPLIQIIMMSVQSEPDYVRRSMLAGAREFLTKPFSSDELVTAIRGVYSRKPKILAPTYMPGGPALGAPGMAPVRLGQVISIYSPKGGVGCSTVAVNLAIALAEGGEEPVLLADANLQFGDLGVLLNLRPDRSITDLVPMINALDPELLDAVLHTHASGLRVLLAPPRPEMGELVSPEHLKKILSSLRAQFQYIVVDTGPALHETTLTVLEMAQRILLVITPDIPTIKNAKLFFELLEALGHTPEKVSLILNKAGGRSNIRIEDIESSIKHPLAAQIPLDETAALSAANKGVPLIVGFRGNPITRSILGLARELRKQEEAAAPEGRKVARRSAN